MVGIVSKLRFAANALTPINQLPPGILCEVFFHCRPVIRGRSEQPWQKRQPFEDLLAITHTYQHWRATAIAATDLWSQLIIRDPHRNFGGVTRLFICRSGELPLDADVGYDLAIVAPHTSRLRTLCAKGAQSTTPPTSAIVRRHSLKHSTFSPTALEMKARPY